MKFALSFALVTLSLIPFAKSCPPSWVRINNNISLSGNSLCDRESKVCFEVDKDVFIGAVLKAKTGGAETHQIEISSVDRDNGGIKSTLYHVTNLRSGVVKKIKMFTNYVGGGMHAKDFVVPDKEIINVKSCGSDLDFESL